MLEITYNMIFSNPLHTKLTLKLNLQTLVLKLLCRLLFWLGNPLKSFPRGHLVVVSPPLPTKLVMHALLSILYC